MKKLKNTFSKMVEEREEFKFYLMKKLKPDEIE